MATVWLILIVTLSWSPVEITFISGEMDSGQMQKVLFSSFLVSYRSVLWASGQSHQQLSHQSVVSICEWSLPQCTHNFVQDGVGWKGTDRIFPALTTKTEQNKKE